ncbi:MAG: hypothetical protein N3B13_05330 [Deltaproteobacteria bacterium]|nr:hypothetical protein [Deltaproteobacteria bacterium]
METIKTKVLIIGENLFSLFLSRLLTEDKIESIIVSSNKSAMLINPLVKYYDINYFVNKNNFSDKIRNFLGDIMLSCSEGLKPLEALYTTGDIVNCSAIYRQHNYYEECKRENQKITFVHIENLQDITEPSANNNFDSFKIKILHKDKIYSVSELASILDREDEGLKNLADEINKYRKESNSLLVLPPVLGMSRTEYITDYLSKDTGSRIFEALTFNPTVITRRFYNILRKYREKENIKVIYENIIKTKIEHKYIKNITTDNYQITPEIVILASERFVEGGLSIRENKVCEPLFNLPVFFRKNKNDISYFTEEDILGSHNFLSCGIKTDDNFKPVDIFGYPSYQNLCSIGSIIINNQDILKNLCDVGILFSIIKNTLSK